MADISDIRELAKELFLMNIANGAIDLDNEMVSNKDYLYNVLKQELDLRAKRKADLLYKGSGLPKKVFDESRITAGLRWQLEELEKIDFHNTRQNVVIVGDCATGKTSLAVQIARDAIRSGASAVYTTEEGLVAAARRQKSHWSKLLKSDLIVLDELFYIKPSEENMQLLYKSVMFLNETRSFIFVTNRPLSEWDTMGVDRHTAATFRQRIMSEAQLIHLG